MTIHLPAPEERGRIWSGGTLRYIAGGLALALSFTLLDGAGAALAADRDKASPAKQAKSSVTQAADIASAGVAARLSGKRVEALSERTETSTTWVNKDGSLTTELSAGPIRFKEDGQWRPVDLKLVERGDGTIEPQAHPNGLELSPGGGTKARSLAESAKATARDLVTLGEGDQQITLQWKGGLPKPKLDGTRATYINALPDADVVVEATRTGYEQFVQIKERPTTGGFSYTLPLKAKGLKVRQQKDGSLLFTDTKDKKRAVMPAPVMWDTTVDKASGEHTHRAGAGMKVVRRKDSIDLVITPDAEFLADPKTRFPVTVDPSTSSLGNVFDTYVQQGETIDWSADTELDLGNPGTTNPDGTPRTARSFITWNTAPISDALVMDAELSLWNFHSGNTDCQTYPWEVWATGAASTSSRWTSQPAWTAKKATSTETRGNPACTSAPDGWINADVTTLVQEWASAKNPTSHMGLRASSETVTAQWKRVNSANAASNPPKLTVTYNYRPKAATGLQAGAPYFSYSGAYVVNSTTPTLRFTTGDANGDQVNGTIEVQDADTQTQVGSYYVTPFVPAGQVASYTVPAGVLTNGKTYRFRVNTYDGTHYNTGWSPWTTFTVDATAPSAPASITSTDYPTGAWVKGAGQAGTFTVTPPSGSDHQWLEWSLDGVTWTKVTTAGSSAAKNISVTPPSDGTHTLQVRTADKADNKSEPLTYTFHAGPGGFLTPGEGERTARRLPLAVEVKAGTYDAVSFSWRRSEADPWTQIPVADVTVGGQPVTAWPIPLTDGKNATATWTATDTVDPDGTVQIKADVTGPNSASASTDPLTVVVDRNAEGAASEEIGPGSVNLLTGNYTLSESDASFFGLEVSRTASSRSPDAGAKQEGQAAIFGDEWTTGTAAELTESDYSHVRRVSNTAVDVVFSDDSAIHFTANAAQSGWIPEPGAEDLTLTGSTSSSFTLSDTEGTVTEFTKPDPAATTWQVSSTLLDGLSNSTTTVVSETVTQDSKTLARPKRVIAPTSAATAAACTATPSTKGCRSLEFVYAATTTATAEDFGDFTGQVKEIKLWATAPGAASATSTTVATYRYDTSGRLRQQWDPRLSQTSQTQYAYDAEGRVIWLEPQGQLPWSFSYGDPGGDIAGEPETGGGILKKVTRATLAPGTADTVNGEASTSLVYGVHLTGLRAPYPMGASDVAAWGQGDAPTDATAILPADAVPAYHNGGDLTATDYTRATVHYLNASGRQVNTATPGGHIDATAYDRFGNTTRELTAANRATALGLTPADQAVLAGLSIESLSTAERAELLSTVSLYNDTGTRETEEFGPLRRVDLTEDFKDGSTVLIASGTSVPARSWTVNEYDEGRPTDGTATVKDQLTLTIAGARVRDYYSIQAEKRVDETQYDWVKGLPTLTIQDSGGLNLTTGTGYDTQGRVTSQVLPGSTGTDAATRITEYWAADGTGQCKGRPEWADQVCWTGPAGAITGGGTNPAELVDTTTEYGYFGQVAQTAETANGVTRMTFTTSDAAGRPETVTVTDGIGQAVPQATTTYDPATGQVTATTSPTAGTITRTYDKLGRPISYTDADGGTTTTEYDLLDRPTKVTDTAPSTLTYTYDHSAEPRGLATRTVDSVAGTFTATYDPDGSVATEKLPGGYTLTQTEDTTGAATSRTYTRDSDGTVVLSDTVTESVHGQVTTHTGSPASISSQTYRYDRAGRLTQVDDTVDNVCTRRTYTFDQRTNRTSLATAAADPGAECTSTGGTTTTPAYDSADRLVDTGYTYDAFGRTTALPGSTLGYYANDLAHQQTAGDKRQTWQLDAALRFRSWTIETNSGGSWAQTESKLNHYDSDSDNPRWIIENTGTGTLTRNVDSLGGDLAATTSATGDTVLQFTTVHGDVALQLPLDTSEAPTALDTDEYGNPRTGQAATRYNWLGGKQRSSETLTGLTLMGVRLYNPATGRFLSIDPVYGGSANAYEYAMGDPRNKYDLDGRWVKYLWKSRKYIKSGVKWATRYKPTKWLFFNKQNKNFVMRDGRPGIHWGNHRNRIEWDRSNGWHFNQAGSSGHYSVWRGGWHLAKHASRKAYRKIRRWG